MRTHFDLQIMKWMLLAGLFLISSNGFTQESNPPAFVNQADGLIQASCIDCHDGSDDNGLNFLALGHDVSDSATFRMWERIYDRVQSGEMPPKSESRPSPELKQPALKAIANALTKENQRFQSTNGRVILRRLTRTEYEHTLGDLLYIRAELGDIIPAENASSSFDTVFSAQGFSPLHVQSYLEAANVALDAAIQLQSEPESKKYRFNYAESKLVKKHLDENKGKDGHAIVGELDDGIVMFSDASYIYKIDKHIEYDGWYKLRAHGFAYNSDKPTILTLNSGDYNRGFTEVVGWFDLQPDKPTTVEVEVRLSRGQYIFPGVSDLDVQPDGKTIWNIGPKDYEGSGVAIKWIELEGPIYEQWPPYSTTNLLKDLKLTKLKNKKWDASRGTHLGYEVDAGEVKRGGDEQRKQLEKIVGWLAPRAFRRPLTHGEGTPFVKLGLSALNEGRSFSDAIRVSLRAILASPNFLFMTPKPGRLDDFSLASRLSYFLWKTMPDRQLFLAARNGELSDPESIKKQVERMLKDDKATRFITDFTNQWLQLSSIDATAPDMRLYPEFDELLKKSMLEETRNFIAHLIEKDLSVSNLIDSDFVFLNRRLAEHYEIDDVKGQYFRKVKLPTGSPRGGLMTQASILKVTANGTTTSPVLRGSWVLTHLLGTPPSPPPPSIGSIEPDTRGTTTIREMLDKHRNEATCASCHQYIDPPGFALESFDVIGGYRERFRSKDQGENTNRKIHGRNIWEYKLGLPVDSSGTLTNGSSFKDVKQYKTLLKDRKEQIARNLIAQFVVYSTGAEIQFADRAKIDKIVDKCRESDFGLRTMIHEVILSDLFLNK